MKYSLPVAVDVLIGTFTIAVIILFASKRDLMLMWLSFEWLAIICTLAYVSPNITRTTYFLNIFIPKLCWPESRHWLWIMAIIFNIISIYETFKHVQI